MAGTGYQSSDLLSLFNNYAGRPTSDVITDPQKYARLAQAQDDVITDIANVAGFTLYGNPTLMTSADGGYTYTFGLDGNGYALFPLSAKIFPNLNSVPNYQWIPGQDYVDEGTQIRSLNNVPFPVAPYFQGIIPPAAMTAAVQPVIQPPQARILIPIRAVLNFAQEGVRNTDLMGIMQSRWDREWAKHTVAIRKHLRGQRRLAPLTSGSPYGAPMQGFGW